MGRDRRNKSASLAPDGSRIAGANEVVLPYQIIETRCLLLLEKYKLNYDDVKYHNYLVKKSNKTP